LLEWSIMFETVKKLRDLAHARAWRVSRLIPVFLTHACKKLSQYPFASLRMNVTILGIAKGE